MQKVMKYELQQNSFFRFGLSMNSIVNGESGIGILSKLSQLSMDLR